MCLTGDVIWDLGQTPSKHAVCSCTLQGDTLADTVPHCAYLNHEKPDSQMQLLVVYHSAAKA